MEKTQYFNFNQVKIILDHNFTKDAFYTMESKEKIPVAIRGGMKGNYRYWTTKHLAQMGEQFRTLSRSSKQQAIVMSCYLTKGGGSYKSTAVFNLARYYGLMGIKTLLIPLDFQMNTSKRFGFDNSPSSIRENRGKYFRGIFECFSDDLNVKDVIYKTDFPNIDIIPESRQLVRFEVFLNSISYNRENAIKGLIKRLKKEYELIIFDNNPSWSILSVNSIVACDILVSPIGCDSNSLDTVELFNTTIEDQLKGFKFKDRVFIAGFTENNVLKKSILQVYHEEYKDYFLRNDIRKSTILDEANSQNLSIFEYAPRSAVCDDFKKVAIELWERAITKNELSRTLQ